MIDVKIEMFLSRDGQSPFEDWFEGLDTQAAAKVATAVTRMGQENMSEAKGVGGGLLEYRIHYGPGYRVYFGKDGNKIIILVGGGTKRHQSKDIEAVKTRWREYKQRKKEGE